MKRILCLFVLSALSFGATASLAVTFTADTNAVADISTYLTKQVSNTGAVSGSLTAAATTIPLVAMPNGVPTTGSVLIESEVVTYAGITGNSLTGCTRGATLTNAANATTAATHGANVAVQFLTYASVRAWVVSTVNSAVTAAVLSLGTSSALVGTQVSTINTNETTKNTALTGAIQ